VACGIHCGDVDACIETYNLLSGKWFTHASPTLFNSGTPQPQLSSCFLLTMADDSIEGIYDTLKVHIPPLDREDPNSLVDSVAMCSN